MKVNESVRPQEKPKKYCSICMGMVFFAINKNNWKIDLCDGCGQHTRVKDELSEDKDDSNSNTRYHRPTPYMHSQLKSQEKEVGTFWKKLEDIFVMFSA
jgi:hypothetical protein